MRPEDKQKPTVQDVKQFWSENPMSYKTDASAFTKEMFEEIDRKFYSKSVPCYTPPNGKVYSHYINYEREIRGKKVLEIGYGLGTMSHALAEAGAELYGIDLSTTHYRATQERMRLFGYQANLVCDNAEKLPFPDNTFDFIFSHGVIHHTPNTQAVVGEMHRVLKHGGAFLVMVYHSDSIRVRWTYHIKHARFRWQNGMKVFCSVGEALSYHSDNHDNQKLGSPIAKAYSRQSGAELFRQFRNIQIDVTGNPGEFDKFPFWRLGKLIPRSMKERMAKRWGYFLMIRGEK